MYETRLKLNFEFDSKLRKDNLLEIFRRCLKNLRIRYFCTKIKFYSKTLDQSSINKMQ
ncbi:hypothetical protein LEP1GSC059_0277 [Leptospira noguchii serovar Panama str. CZ214]|uniref:Uncharacterized protein n=1 Tax=Leptospira noguchii serovar Panama str. CZ214 TaxID=1001595 RepID=T0FJ24_9LEPT|nr:hypothetical protein LEP1GSC059_0277 [Leptospira noguchii serovar Panama str. CZ214]